MSARADIDPNKALLKPKAKQGLLLKHTHNLRATPQTINKAWKGRWVQIRDSAILYYRNSDTLELLGKIPLYLVNSVRKAPKYGKGAFAVTAPGREFIFRVRRLLSSSSSPPSPSPDLPQAESEEAVSEWIFAIQCEFAYHLEELLGRDLNEERSKVEGVERWWKTAMVMEQEEEDGEAEWADKEKPEPARTAPFTLTEVYVRNPFSFSSFSSTPQALPRSETNRLSFTAVVHAAQGHRESMEDAHLVVQSVNVRYDLLEQPLDCSFFAVFDGSLPSSSPLPSPSP